MNKLGRDIKLILFAAFVFALAAFTAPNLLEKIDQRMYYALLSLGLFSLIIQCSIFYRRFKEVQKARRDRLSKILYIRDRDPEEIKAQKPSRTSLDDVEIQCDRYIEEEYRKLQKRIARIKFKPEFITLEPTAKEMGIVMEFLEDKVFVTDDSENRLVANQAFSYSEEGVNSLLSYITDRKNPM